MSETQSDNLPETDNASARLTAGARLAAEKAQAAARKAGIKAKVREQQEQTAVQNAGMIGATAPTVVDYDKTEAGRAVKGAAAWTSQHRNIIFAGAAALFGAVALWAFMQSRAGADTTMGDSLYEGIRASRGIVRAAGETSPSESTLQVFDSINARNQAATAALSRVTTGPATAFARLTEARLLLEARSFAEAERKYESVYASNASDPFLAVQALEGVAMAREGQNNLPGAIEKYQQIGTIASQRYRALSEYNVARLKLRRGQGQDRAQAQTTLRELGERLRAARTEHDGADFAEGYTLTQAETRLRDIDPTAAPATSTGLDGMNQEQIQQLLQRLGQQQQ